MISPGLKSASDDQIAAAIGHADPMALRALLYHATGDVTLRDLTIVDGMGTYGPTRTITDPEDLARLRAQATELAKAYRDGTATPPSRDDHGRLHEAIRLATGAEIPSGDMAIHLDMLALDPTPRGWGDGPARNELGDFEVIVIGTGLAGVNAAIQLKASGIKYRVLDKNAGAGGTWFQNSYPGARVDWPSVLYSHSYGTRYAFRYPYAPQPANEAYINWCVDEHGVRDDIHFDTEVTLMRWDDDDGLWSVHTRHRDGSEKTFRANAVISAIGLLERPSIPPIPGRELFKGPMFHTSQFDRSIDYSDKHVVVVGSGASGMQMIPDLSRIAGHVTVFQRTPPWIFPTVGYRDELPEGIIWLNANLPYFANWNRLIYSWYLGDHGLFDQFQVDPDWPDPHSVNPSNQIIRARLLDYIQEKLGGGPDLLAACTPNYPPFGVRAIPDNGWYDAVTTDKVTLVPEGLVSLTEDSAVAASGHAVKADVIVFATGFNPNEYFSPITVIGRDGVSIEEVWRKDGPRAYWGIAVPQMPNLFILYGPNANPPNLGPVQYAEWATKYFLTCFKAMIENGWKSMEVAREPFDRFNAEMDKRLPYLVTVNMRSAPKTYYRNEFGRSAVQSPFTSAESRVALCNVRFEDYVVTPVAAEPDENREAVAARG